MSVHAEAWVLSPASGGTDEAGAGLRRERFEIPAISSDEVLAAPLFGCWEGNMGHALQRQPIDLCHLRNESRIVLGNAGVVRVLAVGERVAGLEPGQNALIFGNANADRFGYPEKMVGYDAPGTMGCLATRIKLRAAQLIPIPPDTRHSLAQWAAFSVRYITAWSNWRLAIGTFRLQVGEDEFSAPNVWGWGGGTTLAELDLARRFGCRAVMLSGNDKRLETIRKAGVVAVDRREVGELSFDEKRYATEGVYRRAYNRSETAFLKMVRQLTDGEMVQIFVDHIGSAVQRASLRALSRQGVIATAGWKTGMSVQLLRAVECIERHQHIHTHYARRQEALDAVAYGEKEGWMPPIDDRVHSFDEVPELASRFLSGEVGMFPIFSVCDHLD